MSSGMKKWYNKMTGRDNEDGSSTERKVWEFDEDVELVKCFIQNPELKKKQIFEICSENTNGRWTPKQVADRWYRWVRGDEDYLRYIVKHIGYNLTDLPEYEK